MKLSYFEIFLVTISVLLVLFLIGQWIYWKYKRIKYTRERFAFFGLTSILTVLTIILPIVIGSNNAWLIVFNYCLKLFSQPQIRLVEPSISDKILAILILGLIIYLVLRIFNNWNGEVSLRQFEMEKRKERVRFLEDVKAYLNRDKKIRGFNPEFDEKVDFFISENTYGKLAWHLQVAELLLIYSNKFKISPDKDWFRKEKVLLSKYGEEGQLFVLCCQKEPSTSRIKEFLKFVSKYKENKIVKVIIAIKTITNPNRHIFKAKYEYEIEFESESSLIDQLVDFSNYFEYLRAQFEEKPIIDGYRYRLKDIYTPLKAYSKNRKTGNKEKANIPIEDIEKYVSNWLTDRHSNKQLAILGEYGQGKSVMALRIAYMLAFNEIKVDRIPIIIELRGKYPKQYQSIISFLSDWAANFNINPRALLKMHHAGKTLLIFEGFDEMEMVGDHEIRLDHFRRIWEFSTPLSKMIITGRPNFFLNNNELQTLLRANDNVTSLPYCEEIYLEKFDFPQIKMVLRGFDEKIRSDIISILESQSKYDNFFDLMRRPSSLFLASVVWDKRNLSKFKNNINSAIVIEEFLKDSYSRQAEKGSKTPLSIHERAYFMQGIALGLVQKNGYTNQISQNDLKAIILNLYKKFPEEITKRQISNLSYSKSLSKRFDEKYNEESILIDIRSCGILVRDLSTFDSFRFAHKSFLELLVANQFVSTIVEFEDEQDLENVMKNAINLSFNTSIKRIKKSPDCIRFISQIAAKRIFFSKETTPFKKLKILYKKIYRFSHLNMQLVFSCMNLLGINLFQGLKKVFYFLLGLLILGLIFERFIFYSYADIGGVINPRIYAIFFMILFVMGVIFLFKQYNLFKESSLRLWREAFEFTMEERGDTPKQIINILQDRHNIILWYMTAKEIGLKMLMKSKLPRRLLIELEFGEAIVKKNHEKMASLLRVVMTAKDSLPSIKAIPDSVKNTIRNKKPQAPDG